MTLGSLFAGVGGFDLGFERAGMECRWQVEINPFRRAVLATHWPKVERHEDITKCGASNLARVDCITAGVPCQDWSVAGRRAGLEGSRSGLFFEFARILRDLRPTWFVFENVPGLFSSNGGRDFAEVQRVLMVECGYGISWRVLNSQFFGVAQRRCRVYIVGHLGKPCPGEILFEEASRNGNPETGEEARAEVAAAVTSGVGRVGSRGADDGANIVAASRTSGSGVTSNAPGRRREDDYNLVAHTLRVQDGPHGASDRGDGQTNLVVADTPRVTTALRHLGRGGPDDNEAQGGHLVTAVSFAQNQRGELRTSKVAAQLTTGGGKPGEGYPAVIYETRKDPEDPIVIQDVRGGTRDKTDKGQGIGIREGGPSYTLSKTERHGVAYALRKGRTIADSGGNEGNIALCAPPDSDGVRDFAGLPKGMDSPRYQALGDAVTVEVTEWIGRRIKKTHQDA